MATIKTTKQCKECGELKAIRDGVDICQVCERKKNGYKLFQCWMSIKEKENFEESAKKLGLSKREFLASLIKLYNTYYREKNA